MHTKEVSCSLVAQNVSGKKSVVAKTSILYPCPLTRVQDQKIDA